MADTPHILVVDDEFDARNLVRLVLTGQGYTVSEATHGYEAVELAASLQPDLIILDVMMPDMNGYEITRALRADDRIGDRIPIVMFSARGQIDDQAEGYEAGVDDYITKPTHPADLVARVRAVLARRSADTELPAQRAGLIGCLGTGLGVGATTTAANLALALSNTGDGLVVLTEISPGRGGLAGHLRVTPENVGPDFSPDTLQDSLTVYPGALSVLALDVPLETADALDMVAGLSVKCDYLVIDLGTGLNAVSYQLTQLVDWLVVVTAPVRESLTACRTFVTGLQHEEGLEGRISIVLVHQPDCPDPINYPAIQSGLQVPQLHVIPSAPDIMADAAAMRQPVVQSMPHSDIAQVFFSLADEVWEGVQPR